MFKLSLAALWPLLMAKPKSHEPFMRPEPSEPWNHEEEIFQLNHEEHWELSRERALRLNSSADLKRLVL